MRLFAQCGYGPSDKLEQGVEDGNITGIIFDARYSNPDTLQGQIDRITDIDSNVNILMDPEFYAYELLNHPNPQLGYLTDRSYFRNYRRSDLETGDVIEEVIANSFNEQNNYAVDYLVAPNIFVKNSFDSVRGVIAKNFIRSAKEVANDEGSELPVIASIVVDREALFERREFEIFLNDITSLDTPPDGFYLLIGGSSEGEGENPPRSLIYHPSVISSWMMLNYVLNINDFIVINGCSDILTPLLVGSGGYAGATGWWSSLRTFSMARYVKIDEPRRLPNKRYLSCNLLSRITLAEYQAGIKLEPSIKNNLPNDDQYDQDEPSRNDEIRQNWEAVKYLLDYHVEENDPATTLTNIEEGVSDAESIYQSLNFQGFNLTGKSGPDHLQPIADGIDDFRDWAEF